MARPDWGDFQVFLAVARSGQISRAGQQLGLDHATVGRRIARLERSLAAHLFDRSPRGYQLNDAGERLLARVEAMESAVYGAQGDVGGVDLELSGTVRVGVPDGFGTMFLAPRIGALCRAHPSLEVQVVAVLRPFNLSRREADIAIGLSIPEAGRLVGRKLTDYSLHLYATEAYFAERGHPQSAADLRRHRGIGYIQDLIHAPEFEMLTEIGTGLKPRFTSSNLIAQLHATLAGTGLCLLPDFLAAGFPALTRVLPAEVEVMRSFWLIMHQDTRDLARIRVTADFIRDCVEAEHRLFLPGLSLSGAGRDATETAPCAS